MDLTHGKYLGVDYGDVRTGLAECDVSGMLASGITTIKEGGMRNTAERVAKEAAARCLAARVNAANAWGADAFISIHVNSSNITSATGSEGYVYNAESPAFQLAGDIIEGISYYTDFPARGVFVRPSLYVLRRTAMPSTLIELGFISNPEEAAFMNSQPVLYARGIYYGLKEFYGVN